MGCVGVIFPCRRENNLLVAAKPSRRMLDSVSVFLYAMKDDVPIVLKLGRGKFEHCVGVPFPCRRENNLLVAAQPSRRMLDSASAILYAMKDDVPIVLKHGRGKVEHCVGVPFPCRRENNLLVAAKPRRRML